MTDLTKPIRRRDDKRPAVATKMRVPECWLVEYVDRDGDWTWAVHHERNMEATFENVPPPQEWRWLLPHGMMHGSLTFTNAGEAREWALRMSREGQPVRILREGETP